MEGFNSIKDVMNNYVEGLPKKVNISWLKVLGKAILAGAMVAVGASASNVAAHGIENVGLCRLVSGAVFPVGLMMIILLGAELFTGDCMVAVGVCKKKISIGQCLKFLVLVYIGNDIGSVLYAALTYLSGQFNYSNNMLGAYTIKIALSKATIPFGRAIVSGILCNFLVCIAVLMALCAKDVAGKLLSAFFVILAFVTSGFEHCVANMYYIPAGIICLKNPAYVEAAKMAYNITDAELKGLSLWGYHINNLLPVTIGNIIGGALCVGIPILYLANAKSKTE